MPTPTPLSSSQANALFVSVFVIAICSIIYELIIGTLSSYLFGNSVLYFSLTIGLFMSAMGIGSYLSQFIRENLLERFILIEISIGLIGGCSAAILNTMFATSQLYHVTLVVLILLIGICVGLEIPLLTRLSGGTEALKNNLANILALDYLGALVGSILFPFIMLPQLGLLKASFVTGLLNITVVGLTMWYFRDMYRQKVWLSGVAALTATVLVSGTVGAAQLTSFFEDRLYRYQIVYAEQTSYQRIVVTNRQDDTRLYLDGNLQFSTIDEYRYHDMLVHPAMSLSRSREQVLLLGGGDGLVAREVFKYDEVARLVMVDIDPAMTRLAHSHPIFRRVNHGAMDDPRLEVVHADAFNYLVEASDLFGVIIIDLPDPNNEALAKLYSREFYQLVNQHLAQGGVMAMQASSPYFSREAFWSIHDTLAATGIQTWPYRAYVPTFGEWGFILAANHRLDPAEFEPRVPLRYLTPPLFQNAFLFDSDTDHLPVEISTLDHPVILDYYLTGWQRWQ